MENIVSTDTYNRYFRSYDDFKSNEKKNRLTCVAYKYHVIRQFSRKTIGNLKIVSNKEKFISTMRVICSLDKG